MASHKGSSSYASSSNPTWRRTWIYDIFLSFRGADTRKGFTSHLYQALINDGFRVFRDDEELRKGDSISQELLQAIEESHIAIVILSKNYASSSWCLDELQHILASRNNEGQIVLPIFYDVDPSDIRNKKGPFGEAFAELIEKKKFQKEQPKVKKWSDSLTEVANLSGFDSRQYRLEAELIVAVTEELWTKLDSRLPPHDSEELIGIDKKVKQLEPLLEMGLDDVRFVGLWGLAGVGKTTIAWAVFEKYRSQFGIRCFLPNVRATSLEGDGEAHLQRELLPHLEIKNKYDGKKQIQTFCRNKKVLLILDDVSHRTHFEILADSPNWFGAGSRVIITTRNSDLLRRVHKVYKHEVKTMNSSESLQLFCQKAFGRGEPQEDLLKLSKTVCDYAKGLPLALSVLGSFFCGRSVSEWEDTLDNLKKDPHKDIFDSLQISFNALTNKEKSIFLDIACFFSSGWRKNIIIQILESCGFDHAKIGIKALQRKSMLEDYGHRLVMHDLLVQMGRKIVVESSNDVGHRTRLWSKEDIDKVMKNKWGTKEIQGMVSSTSCEASWNPNAFLEMRNLRLLIVTSNFDLPYGLQCLSHALKVLHWTKYPLDNLPPETRLDELIDLKMRHSKLKKFGNESLCLKELKFLDLSYSKNLIETLDVSELPNLERLELEGCEDIVDLHASIGRHTKLCVLNLKGCKKLRNWCLKKLEMIALKEFVLFGCIQIKCLPEFGESMKNLEILDAGETNLVKLPESLGLLTGLKTLKLSGCTTLVCLPQSIHQLKRLVFVDIAGCSKFAELPKNLNEMVALEEINASETGITEVPCSIGGLNMIKKLSFQRRKRLKPNSLTQALNFMFWRHSIHKGLALPGSMFNLKSLEELNLSYCGIDDESVPDSFNGLSSLKMLNLSGNLFKKLDAGCVSNLLKLKNLFLTSCSELRSLPQLGPNLITMNAVNCGSLEAVSEEQVSNLFDEWDYEWWGDSLSVSIPGSEIPLWFKNQNDVCLKENGDALMMIDIAPCPKGIVGIGVCIVLDDRFFPTAEPKPSAVPTLYCPLGTILIVRQRFCQPVIESSHLWMVFWKHTEKLNGSIQSREHSHIPLIFASRIRKRDAKHSLKCGWRVIRKGDDFENWDYSMTQSQVVEQITQSLLSTAEQHNDQGEFFQNIIRACETSLYFQPKKKPHYMKP